VVRVTDLPPAAGHNIAVPSNIAERLESDFSALLAAATDELSAAEALPEVVGTAADLAEVAAAIVKLRDLAARAESHRRAEKEVWLRGGEAVDAFFFKRLRDPLDLKRRILTRRLDTFKQRQLAEERARRGAEAVEAKWQQQEAARLSAEAETAVHRARSSESKSQREEEAAAARVESDLANTRATDSALAAKTKPGRMVGEHFEGERSGLVTLRRQEMVIVDDASKLDLETLRPYFKEENLLPVLRAWAKATGFAREMPGATIAVREATVVR
jgi:hypothetical protein